MQINLSLPLSTVFNLVCGGTAAGGTYTQKCHDMVVLHYGLWVLVLAYYIFTFFCLNFYFTVLYPTYA